MTRARTKRRRQQLEELWEAQGKHCYLCGQKMYPVSHTAKKTGWTADHVWPQSRGHSRVRNVLLAHASCNRDKKDRNPFACELLLLQAVNEKLTIWDSHRDNDRRPKRRDVEQARGVSPPECNRPRNRP